MLATDHGRPGPKAFSKIRNCPLKDEIDRRLFEAHESTASVHRWLQEHGQNAISYATLHRYANSRQGVQVGAPSDRLAHLERTLKTLDQFIRAARRALNDRASTFRPSDLLRAMELKKEILTQFPDLTDQRVAEVVRVQETFTQMVLEVITEDQRERLRARLKEHFPEAGQ